MRANPAAPPHGSRYGDFVAGVECAGQNLLEVALFAQDCFHRANAKPDFFIGQIIPDLL